MEILNTKFQNWYETNEPNHQIQLYSAMKICHKYPSADFETFCENTYYRQFIENKSLKC